MKLTIELEKRKCDPKNVSAINVNVDGEHYRNVWTLRDAEITEDVIYAIKNAIKIGIKLSNNASCIAASGISFSNNEE